MRIGGRSPVEPTPSHFHVGHGKTGSSAIQSALARAAPELERLGYCYPEHKRGDLENARRRRISSGNIRHGVSISDVLGGIPRAHRSKRVVISSEGLFPRLVRGELSDDIRSLSNDGHRFTILLLIRDPLDHVDSIYQQAVKRRGYTESFEYFALRNFDIVKLVAQFLETCRSEGLDVTVRNYSRWSNDLASVVGEWLGIEPGFLAEYFHHRVNRSLTRAELELQRLFNQAIGPTSSLFVSDPLVNELPDTPSENMIWTEAGLRRFLSAIRADTEMVNPVLPPDERYVVPPIEKAIETYCGSPVDARTYSFNREQLEVVVEHIAEFLVRRGVARRHVYIPTEGNRAELAVMVDALTAELNATRDVEHRLALLESSKTFRWTRAPRSIYARWRERVL